MKKKLFIIMLSLILFLPISVFAGNGDDDKKDDGHQLSIPSFSIDYINDYTELYTCKYRLNLHPESPVFFGSFDFVINFSKLGNSSNIVVSQSSTTSDLTDMDVSKLEVKNSVTSPSYALNKGYQCPELMAFLTEKTDEKTGKLIALFEVKNYDSDEYNKYYNPKTTIDKYYILHNYNRVSYNCSYNEENQCKQNQHCHWTIIDLGHREYGCVESEYNKKNNEETNTMRTESCSGYVESIFKQTVEYSFSVDGKINVSLGSGNFSFSGSNNFVDKDKYLWGLWKEGKCCSEDKLGITYSEDSTQLSCDGSGSTWNYEKIDESSDEDNNSSNKDSNLGKEQYGCDVVPSEVKKWIEILLNFVKYVALILVVVLGTLDFIKAASSGEADSMKKAGQSFLKRVIAVIILFLLPMIVELILDLINLYGSKDCFEVLK